MKTTLILILTICALTGYGQVKIGNITVADSTAKLYFLDCYKHPDTVYEQNQQSYLTCSNCSVPMVVYEDAKAKADAFNDQLRKNAVGKLEWSIPQRYLVPRKPSEIDFIKWYAKLNLK